jgi:1-phosphofructokinase family hexose kinase
MSILVVALNPSVDVEWRVADVQWEEKNVLESERRWPGGKGVNVARWLRFLGSKSTLLIPLGGNTGEEMRLGLERDEAHLELVRISEATRANVIVTTNSGRQLRFNPPGPKISARKWKEIVARFRTSVKICSSRREEAHFNSIAAKVSKKLEPRQLGSYEEASVGLVVLSGSLPRGVPVTAYKQLIKEATRAGVKVLLDCDGAPFAEAVPAKPFLVKPNEHELSIWIGRKLKTDKALLDAARELSKVTSGWVLLSRGARGGVLINAADGQMFVEKAPQIKVQNTVGAGDAMLAAVASQVVIGAPPCEWLRRGIATGSTAAQLKAGELPARRPSQSVSRM